MAGKTIFYFRDKEARHKAYNILAGHNFYFPYGPSVSLTDIDEPDYMLELLEAGGFNTAEILVEKPKETSSNPSSNPSQEECHLAFKASKELLEEKCAEGAEQCKLALEASTSLIGEKCSVPSNDIQMNHSMLLAETVKEFGSPGIVVDPELAKKTTCTCYRIDKTFMCFSKGIIGTLKYPEQVEEYCPTMIEKESPALKERIEKFKEAAEVAHKRIEHLPKGERLEPWLRAMGEELSERGIKI